jgi:glycosyltransferase involved in cell wall biosynthesis
MISSEKINILHICETSGIGGAETVLYNIVSSLDKSRYNSVVLLYRTGWLYDKLRDIGTKTIVMADYHSWDIRLFLSIRRAVKDEHIHLIHSHLPDANAHSSIVGFFVGVPVITTYHGKISYSPNIFNITRMKLSIVRRLSSRVVAVSNYLKNALSQVAGLPPGKIATIYNGIEMGQYDTSIDIIAKKKQLGLNPDDKIVGITANQRPDKGYEYFVRAAALINAKMPDVKFLLIGEEQADIKARLVKELKNPGFSDKVYFLGFRSDVRELLRIMDVFVLSSISEGLSIATIEAMAAGIPVIVTRSGGPEEIVIDGETGYLVPIKNEREIADKAIELLTHEELRAKISARAKENVRAKFNIENMISNYDNLYRDVLSSKG